MNQRVVAGIGNIYSDEILFQARLHPRTGLERLDGETLEELHAQTLRVLKAAITMNKNTVGVYATVVQTGPIHVGDPVGLVPDAGR